MALFVAGTGIASATWQVLLVAAGGILHRRASPRARTVTVLAGNCVVAALGTAMLVSAVT